MLLYISIGYKIIRSSTLFQKRESLIEKAFNGITEKRIFLRVKAWSGKDVCVSKQIVLSTDDYKWRNGIHDFAVNLGCTEGEVTRVQIALPETGIYSVDDILVISQPLDTIRSGLKRLQEHTLRNVDLHNDNGAYATDTVTGNIETDEPVRLLLAIPYSSGWSAYVDDKPARLSRSNTMFMSLYIPAGQHELLLRYRTPGFGAGCLIMAVGILIFIWRGLYENRHIR